MPYKDLAKQREAQHRHYLKNKTVMKKRAGKHRDLHRVRLAEYVNLQKANPCMDCGIQYPPCVMDFDHCMGEKDQAIATAVQLGWSMTRLQAEIAKCELVCANCHRLRTYTRRQALVG